MNDYLKKLQKEAEIDSVKYLDNSIPLFKYIHYGKQLLKQSIHYQKEKKFDYLYVYLFRFVCLFCNVISKHNSKNDIKYKRDIFELRKQTNKALEIIESLQQNELKNTTIQHVQKLRTVLVNMRMVDEFLNYAFDTLSKGIEFCGILAGTLCNDIFKVTHLIIPKQIATPDTCQALQEIEIYEYQNKNDIITLGWIHVNRIKILFLILY